MGKSLNISAIKLSLLIILLAIAGCNYEPLMVFSGKGDPDVVRTPENSQPNFSFRVIENEKSPLNKNNSLNVHLKLKNANDSLLLEGYTDSKGKVIFNLSDEESFPEGNYVISALIYDPVYGVVTHYSNTSFYYPGYPYSINKSLIIYPVR